MIQELEMIRNEILIYIAYKEGILPQTDYLDYIKSQIQTITSGASIEILMKPKAWHCKDCKWWKDSDGSYRRGSHAESKCPINRKEVYEGNGYCFLFEPQESEDKK